MSKQWKVVHDQRCITLLGPSDATTREAGLSSGFEERRSKTCVKRSIMTHFLKHGFIITTGSVKRFLDSS